ncbi:WDFY3 [Acanthosepion pharaonis]|uniref:WDFY3 n=1 Tax=Acanthosepion pharaonis TaxID=158019 RepID=A0A812BBL7_ACAPH|nr:WDFY3 [Sepia pharaonis]
MRKFVSPRAAPEPSSSAIGSQDNALGLMHLRKLFAEYRQPTPNVTQKEQEDKLYNMLPLFCKVFDSSPSSEMTEKFGDIQQFCSQVSKLMVTEIRRRASNQSTATASCSIVNFLEVESPQENNRGSQALVDRMTAASLPSTLVKCLYLFFDLPSVPCTDVLEDGYEFTPKERRILLQKVFVQFINLSVFPIHLLFFLFIKLYLFTVFYLSLFISLSPLLVFLSLPLVFSLSLPARLFSLFSLSLSLLVFSLSLSPLLVFLSLSPLLVFSLSLSPWSSFLSLSPLVVFLSLSLSPGRLSLSLSLPWSSFLSLSLPWSSFLSLSPWSSFFSLSLSLGLSLSLLSLSLSLSLPGRLLSLSLPWSSFSLSLSPWSSFSLSLSPLVSLSLSLSWSSLSLSLSLVVFLSLSLSPLVVFLSLSLSPLVVFLSLSLPLSLSLLSLSLPCSSLSPFSPPVLVSLSFVSPLLSSPLSLSLHSSSLSPLFILPLSLPCSFFLSLSPVHSSSLSPVHSSSLSPLFILPLSPPFILSLSLCSLSPLFISSCSLLSLSLSPLFIFLSLSLSPPVHSPVHFLFLSLSLSPVHFSFSLSLSPLFISLSLSLSPCSFSLSLLSLSVLVRLCSHISPAEELARKDDLSLLFNAITSWCHPHSIPWRKSAGEILVTLSRHGLTPQVVNYIHEKGCVRHCIENMQRAQELSPIEMVEMIVTVFCFLKDSSEVSHTLLDDFRSSQGYIFLSEFLLKLEQSPGEDSQQALRNLVLLVGSLTTCGFIELKPSQASTGSLFQMPGFTLPQATGKGVSVKNIQLFQATSVHLCCNILDVISSIYHQDDANYFILESQHTLSQFAEKIYLKPPDIQQKFFELLEFIVFNLNFVPCKELISLSILIKTQHSVGCSILCMKSLLKILRYHNVYKDVFREVGMLEVMVTCLHRYAALLKEPQNGTEREAITEEQMELGFLVMEALATLLNSNSSNASVFRECGGARCAHNMVPYTDCQHQALNIVQQLVLSPGGDDDMGTLLGLMHTAPVTALELKTHILKSLLNVLRESHRTRTVFRKVGGFVYVMSVFVSMEGCLASPPKSPWDQVGRHEILTMLKTVFSTLTVAMRYEPANAKFFSTEVRYDSLTEAVRLLGCFSNTIDILPDVEELVSVETQTMPEAFSIFEEFFNDVKDSKSKEELPLTLQSACLMIRFLYDMTLDSFDKEPGSGSCSTLKRNISFRVEGPHSNVSLPKRASTGSINLYLASCQDQIIVHPGAVMSIFHLLPAIEYSPQPKLALDLQVYTAEILKSIMRTERNQQIMCDVGFPHELLSHGNIALADESHSLHPPLQYMFERLAAQALTPKDLKDFVRLGSPLNCWSVDDLYDGYRNGFVCSHMHNGCEQSRGHNLEEKRTPFEIEDQLKTAGGPVPLTRVKCLVSMTTPRDARMHGSSVTPAFVEFDMSTEGFGCLYLPSIAPQGPPTPSVVGGVVGSSDPVVIGGIGTGERMFPPQSGLTYSTWFCVDKFSCASTDPHSVRLLTIVRNLQGRDENLICLSVTLTAKDRSLIVSTQETSMPTTVTGCDQEEEPLLGDNTVRFWCPDLTQEGQWHHLILIFHRAGIMKNSNVSLFLDSHHVNTQKFIYIIKSIFLSIFQFFLFVSILLSFGNLSMFLFFLFSVLSCFLVLSLFSLLPFSFHHFLFSYFSFFIFILIFCSLSSIIPFSPSISSLSSSFPLSCSLSLLFLALSLSSFLHSLSPLSCTLSLLFLALSLSSFLHSLSPLSCPLSPLSCPLSPLSCPSLLFLALSLSSFLPSLSLSSFLPSLSLLFLALSLSLSSFLPSLSLSSFLPSLSPLSCPLSLLFLALSLSSFLPSLLFLAFSPLSCLLSLSLSLSLPLSTICKIVPSNPKQTLII